MSPKNSFLDFSLTRSLFFGDSTFRNFENFMKWDLRDSLYATIMNHPDFLRKYYETYNLLYPLEPFKTLHNFTLSLVDYDQTMRKRLPSMFSFYEQIRSHCHNLSLTSWRSPTSYVVEAYNDLDSTHVPYYSLAVDSCNQYPDRLLMFVVTGGLHYLAVI
jgi:hypothetical protein